MDKKILLPIGVDNFSQIRNENYYYVDKSSWISSLLNNRGLVNLFTRPRRFGKTLNMSMLKSFFEVGTDKAIFEGLAISKDKELCEQYMGKYPVISISLKSVNRLHFDDAFNKLKDVIFDEASRFQFLIDSDKLTEYDKIPLRPLIERDKNEDITSSLKQLCRLLEKHYGKKVILLIDEYDVPLDKAYENGFYNQMIDIMRTLLGETLKSNDSLFFAVLTGGLRVSKESIFTGLNNLEVNSITDVQYDEYFGFTDEEVKKLLADYNLESHYDDVKQWYDGYLFGTQKVYCPWDVIKYCKDLLAKPNAKPKAYWLNTSGNDSIKRLINKTDADGRTTKADIEKLIDGQTINKRINEQLTHSEIDDSVDNIWSLLFMTGYLTLASEHDEDDMYALKIPNQEITQIYKQQVLSWFNDRIALDKDELLDVYQAFKQSDTETITNFLNKKLEISISYYDARESFYHGFLLAILTVGEFWGISSNDEVGNGRADIILEKGENDLGIIIEIKVVKDIKKLDEACKMALKQIEDKDYAADFKEHNFNKILAYGIAFCGKKCKVIVKKIR